MHRVGFELYDSIFSSERELHALYCVTVPGDDVWTAQTEQLR
jgi:hypothetical protein